MRSSLFFVLLSIYSLKSFSQVTYTVKVPRESRACYIAGQFNSWTQQAMNRVNDSVYTLTIATATPASNYKYCSGPTWDYVEKAGNGGDINDRTYTPNDVVLRWNFTWYPHVPPLTALNNNGDVMIQGFNWNSWMTTTGWYNLVATKAVELKNAGINVLWLPPPSDAAANEGYLPRQLYLFNSRYGSEQQLKTLITTLHTNNIKVLADIVINHRVGTTNWGDFTNPVWGCWAVTADDEWSTNGGNPCGSFDSGESFLGGRDLDHRNATVQRDLIAWLRHLRTNIGFDGWRHDYAKGFPPSYTKMYDDSTAPYVSIGEFFDGDTARIRNWLNGTGMESTAFDFPLKFILGQAVAGNYSVLNNTGRSTGLIGSVPCNSVTFLDNHDTYRTAGQNFPSNKTAEGYAYLLTHPGIPMIFWNHYFDSAVNKNAINTLISIRKSNNISCSSVLDIQQATANEYAAIIDGKLALRLGTGTWIPAGTGWNIKATGPNYTVWDKLPALPVTLSSINARWVNANDAMIEWSTLTEINARHFEVEKSINGNSFEVIGTVAATGNSTSKNEYKYADVNANKESTGAPGSYLYRIKTIDKDGKYTYSPVVRLAITKKKQYSISPNPVKSTLYIRGLNASQNHSIAIVNAAGLKRSVVLKAGISQIEVSGLASGVYYLTIDGETTKFIKKD